MQEFTGAGTQWIRRHYSSIGSVLSILLAMPEVLVPTEIAPEGSTVNYVSETKMGATISKAGIAYLGLLCGLTFTAVAIALFSLILSTEDSRGRVVRVRSESKYG